MENLMDFREVKYSSTGNDGIIKEIFKRLKITRGSFVEFGAWDGIVNSNCRSLFENGWSGCFIECDERKYQDLVKNYKDNARIICVKAKVDSNKNKFDDVIKCFITKRGLFDIDFCSIDVDGEDLEIFNAFDKVLPKVICIEGGQMLHPQHPEIPLKKARNNIQQSLTVMNEVFYAKGYTPICSYQDTFYVRNEYCKYFNTSENVYTLYFDGLQAIFRRIPWIVNKLKENKLNNLILNKILENTGFSKFKYPKRKDWARTNKDIILSYIKNLRKEYE